MLNIHLGSGYLTVPLPFWTEEMNWRGRADRVGCTAICMLAGMLWMCEFPLCLGHSGKDNWFLTTLGEPNQENWWLRKSHLSVYIKQTAIEGSWEDCGEEGELELPYPGSKWSRKTSGGSVYSEAGVPHGRGTLDKLRPSAAVGQKSSNNHHIENFSCTS